jgi:ubiquinone/menaquinone biosynthesis C-methylase UbiE
VSALDEAALRAREAFDAAADHYDDAALGFWSRVGERTVERLGLHEGDRVLDVPCGSGASALHAARAVGASGYVVAVDLAPALLDLVRAKAAREGIANLETREADMRALGYPDASFDAVVCVFGVFFVPDRTAIVRELWRLVRPGGVLAITTWDPRVLEPGASAFWDAVRAERAELVRGFNPWDDLVEEEQLLDLYARADIRGAAAVFEPGEQRLATADDFWTIALGSGFRGTIDRLDDAARERVRKEVARALAGVDAVEASAVYGVARKA